MNEVKVITACFECPCYTDVEEPNCGMRMRGDLDFPNDFDVKVGVIEVCPLRNGKLVIKLDKSLIFTKE